MGLRKNKVSLHTDENELYELISTFDCYCGEYIDNCEVCNLITDKLLEREECLARYILEKLLK